MDPNGARIGQPSHAGPALMPSSREIICPFPIPRHWNPCHSLSILLLLQCFVLHSSPCISGTHQSSRTSSSTSLTLIILLKMVSTIAILKGALLALPCLVAATGQLGFSLGVKHNPVSYSICRTLWITDSSNRIRMAIASSRKISRRIST